MNYKINDGGPAFPVSFVDDFEAHKGMSLRAWFAGMALQGELSSQGTDGAGWVWKMDNLPELAGKCCACADALIAELNKTP